MESKSRLDICLGLTQVKNVEVILIKKRISTEDDNLCKFKVVGSQGENFELNWCYKLQ